MRVLVAGGGIGGLAAALALARTGASVEVLERAAAFGEVGAGLQLAPNATRILHRWGLEAALARIAFAPEAVEVRDHADGRLLHRTPLGAAALARWGAPYLQVHRADLHAILSDAAQAAGVVVRCGASVSDVSDHFARGVPACGCGLGDGRSARRRRRPALQRPRRPVRPDAPRTSSERRRGVAWSLRTACPPG